MMMLTRRSSTLLSTGITRSLASSSSGGGGGFRGRHRGRQRLLLSVSQHGGGPRISITDEIMNHHHGRRSSSEAGAFGGGGFRPPRRYFHTTSSNQQLYPIKIVRSANSHPPPKEEDESSPSSSSKTTQRRNIVPPPEIQKQIHIEIQRRRKQYRESLRQLRKQYATEYQNQKLQELSQKQAEQQRVAIEAKKRRYKKLLKSIENEKQQQVKRERRRLEWEEELAITQKWREERNERYRKARQLVIDELEQECHLWMTTPEEVENTLNYEASQNLWSHPHTHIGAPPPEDGFFWRYESESNHVLVQTYQTPGEYLLQEVHDLVYDYTNLDDEYWSEEKVDVVMPDGKTIEQMTRWEEMLYKRQRARLRAMVERETVELLKRRAMEEERLDLPNPELHHLLPKNFKGKTTMVVPSNHPLRDLAVKQKGSNGAISGSNGENGGGQQQHHPRDYENMETNVALHRANLSKFFTYNDRTNQFVIKNHESYPLQIGRLWDEDTRSEKEKAKAKKLQDAMWERIQHSDDDDELDKALAELRGEHAAVARGVGGGEGVDDLVLSAQEQGGSSASAEDGTTTPATSNTTTRPPGEIINQDETNMELLQYESKLERDLVTGPLNELTDERDIDWVLEQLNKKVEYLQGTVEAERAMARQRGNSAAVSASSSSAAGGSGADADGADDVTTTTISEEEGGGVIPVGAEMERRLEQIVNTLTDEQMADLLDITFDDTDGGRKEFRGHNDVDMLRKQLVNLGLNDQQVDTIIELELENYEASTTTNITTSRTSSTSSSSE